MPRGAVPVQPLPERRVDRCTKRGLDDRCKVHADVTARSRIAAKAAQTASVKASESSRICGTSERMLESRQDSSDHGLAPACATDPIQRRDNDDSAPSYRRP